MAKLEVEGLCKVFGPAPGRALELLRQGAAKDEIRRRTGATVAVADVSFAVEAGATFVVMGLSGSGKSTLLRCLNRLIEPTAGSVRLDGVELGALPRAELRELRRRRLGMVFQRFGLLPHRRVLDNVAYGLAVRGLPRPERHERARRWIATVGLEGYERAWPAELSGGMQQRVGLARALATDPEVLLMDEPFSALDPLHRREMQDQLLELQDRLHKTIVFITHDLDEALRLGDRIAILKDGRVVQIGSPRGIVFEPADGYVAAFVRDVPRLRVLTAGAVMVDPAPGAAAAEPVGAAAVAPETPVEELLPALLGSARPVAVVGEDGAGEEGRVLGVVTREALVEALAGGPSPSLDEEERGPTRGRRSR